MACRDTVAIQQFARAAMWNLANREFMETDTFFCERGTDMISAAEAQLVGWPLPAAVVARMESILSRVAFSSSKFNSISSIATVGINNPPSCRPAVVGASTSLVESPRCNLGLPSVACQARKM
jgi:hypothetical protein